MGKNFPPEIREKMVAFPETKFTYKQSHMNRLISKKKQTWGHDH